MGSILPVGLSAPIRLRTTDHMRWILITPFLALPAACADETLTGYADPAAVYVLTEIDDAPAPARVTITFADPGRIAGNGPCNRYFAVQEAPYPWFEPGPIGSTRRACPQLKDEAQFFAALSQMSLAEVQGPVLILSNDAGRELVFRAE